MYPMMNDAVLRNIVFISTRVELFYLSPVVLSIIATEMYFRNSLHRLAEYFAWILLWHLGSKRVETLSVGIAQIQIKRWVELGFIDSFCQSISNIAVVANVEKNYLACLLYLGKIASYEGSDPKVLSELYSGKARVFHSKVIATTYEAAVRISLKKASSRRAKYARGQC